MKTRLIYAFCDEELSADDMVKFAQEMRRPNRFAVVLPCEGFDVAVCYSAPRKLKLEAVAALYVKSTKDLDESEYPPPDLSDVESNEEVGARLRRDVPISQRLPHEFVRALAEKEAADPRNDAEASYKAFMSMPQSEWLGLIDSLTSGGVLRVEEKKGFDRALKDRGLISKKKKKCDGRWTL